VATLSLKYHGLVFSTAGKISHAVVGPPDRERDHPAIRTFHKPEPGRLASVEDYTYLPYEYWSPFQSRAYAKHQMYLMYSNALHVINAIPLDPLHFGLFCALCGLLVHAPWRENLGRERWRWAGVPIAFICGIYLPVFAYADRYYLPAYPFLVAAGIGMVVSLTPHVQGKMNRPRLVGLALVTLYFGIAACHGLRGALRGIENPSAVCAAELAGKLKAAGLQGAMAGAGKTRGWDVQYVEGISFYLGQPYYGHEINPTPERIKDSGAKLVFVRRGEPLTKQLDRDPAFTNLDPLLFESDKAADQFPVSVYQVDDPS
jgi:hypothetical protein